MECVVVEGCGKAQPYSYWYCLPFDHATRIARSGFRLRFYHTSLEVYNRPQPPDRFLRPCHLICDNARTRCRNPPHNEWFPPTRSQLTLHATHRAPRRFALGTSHVSWSVQVRPPLPHCREVKVADRKKVRQRACTTRAHPPQLTWS